MTIIKIFIASSKELETERDKFASLINQLNRLFKPRGIELELVIWEYLNSSMAPKRKQEEYNDELKRCDICLVVLWNKLGEFTVEELKIAYNEMCIGHNPKRLYVFFKEPASMTDEMKIFKDTFADEFGHFYNVFETADTLKLNFLLQLEIFKNEMIDVGELISVENSFVKIDKTAFVDLRNVSFAAKNESYISLQQQIAKQRNRLLKYPDDIDEQSELHALLVKRQDIENNMLSLARTLSEQSLHTMSPRMIEARKLFEMGELQAVIKLLDTQDIISDITSSKSKIDFYRTLYESELSNIEHKAAEIQLRIKAEKILLEEGWPEKISKEYHTLIEEIRGYCSPITFARILLEAARFIEDYIPNSTAIFYYTECMDTMKPITDISSVLPEYGDMLFFAGRFFSELVYEIDYDPTAGEWLDESNVKIHNKVMKRWNRYRKFAKRYLEMSIKIFRKIDNKKHAEDIYYSLACLVRYESVNGDANSENAAHRRLLEYIKSSGLSYEFYLSALTNFAITLYADGDNGDYNQVMEDCNQIVRDLNTQTISTSTLLDLTNLYEMKKDYQKAMYFCEQALERYRELAFDDPYAFQENIANCLERIAMFTHWLTTDYRTNPKTKLLLEEAENIYDKLHKVTESDIYWRKRGHIKNLKFELRLKERMDYCSYLFKSIRRELIQYFSSHLKSGQHTFNIEDYVDCPIRNISTIIRKVRKKDAYNLSFTWEFDSWQTGYEWVNMDLGREFPKDELCAYLSSPECYDKLCDYIVRGIDKGGHMD